MFGYESIKEFETIPMKKRYTPESFANSEMRLERQRRGEPVADGWEVSVVRKDGEVRHLQVFRNEVLWEGQLHLEQKVEEQTGKLRASEVNFRNSLENSPIGIRIVNSEGKTIYANRAFLDIFGYSNATELDSVPYDKLYTPETYAAHQERVRKGRLGETVPSKYENDIVRKNGEIRRLLVNRGEVFWNGEKRFQMLYQDVTERVQAEKALQAGYDILKGIDFPWPVAQAVLQHHERLNGSGYPGRLSGDSIILEARVLAVSDVVEAMASHRPYRASLGIDKALEEISQKRGSLYDSAVVDACLKLFKEKGFNLIQTIR